MHPLIEDLKFLPILMLKEIIDDLTSKEPSNKSKIESASLPEIFEEVKTSKYIGHSCLIFLVNMNCLCRSELLVHLFDFVNENEHLRHKAKLFLTRYYSLEPFGYFMNKHYGATDNTTRRRRFRLSDEEIKNMGFPGVDFCTSVRKTNTELLKNVNTGGHTSGTVDYSSLVGTKGNYTGDSGTYSQQRTNLNFKKIKQHIDMDEYPRIIQDYLFFCRSYLDNSIFVQILDRVAFHESTNMKNFLHQSYNCQTLPIHQIFIDVVKQEPFLYSLYTSSTEALYCFSINPTVVFVINSYYFTTPTTPRKGSGFDVIYLIRAFKIRGLHYVLIEDCSKEQLLKVLEYLKKKDFYPVQNFLFWMMSHGSSGNIIRTYDGELDINDIVNSIQSNKSLKNALKLFLFNNCRGSIDVRYADQAALNRIQPTNNDHLDENSVVVYAVRNELRSFRSSKEGCAFPTSFSIELTKSSPNETIDAILERVNEMTRPSFCRLTNYIEVVRKNHNRTFRITPIPIASEEMVELCQSIENELEQILNPDPVAPDVPKTQFFICGTRKKEISQENPLFPYYCEEELDRNQCAYEAEYKKNGLKKKKN